MRNTAVINLNTLRYNAKLIKKSLPKSVKFCAVVKADAYGHGAEEIANAIYSIVDCYAVAIIEEGVSLRLSGIDKDILVLTPISKAEVYRAVFYGLTVSISSVRELEILNAECESQNKSVNVHIAYNSGMNRLGVSGIPELKRILRKTEKCPRIKLTGFYSHFSCPEKDKERKKQLDKFLLANKVVKGYNNNVISHISASGGFLKGEYLDMVRIGILLYGYKPYNAEFRVKPIMKVYSTVVKRRTVKRGEICLYGNKRLKRTVKVNIVRNGYADGFIRKKTKGLINNRCMDLTGYVGKTTRVVLDDADKLAKKYKTISYEILCLATKRADKKYIR